MSATPELYDKHLQHIYRGLQQEREEAQSQRGSVSPSASPVRDMEPGKAESQALVQNATLQNISSTDSESSAERQATPETACLAVNGDGPVADGVDGTSVGTGGSILPKDAPDAATMTLDNYVFPGHKVEKVLHDTTKTPLVLVACGSFSPPTFLHLRLFEMARDWIKHNSDMDFEVIGGFLSPVGDAYKKAGLASAVHRINMCNLGIEGSKWITVDAWEALHREYLPTALVLDHFSQTLNKDGGILTYTGERRKIHVALLAGADLIQTFSTPGVWDPKDIDYILRNYGAFVLERAGTDVEDALTSLERWRDNIWVIPQLVQNDVSSTKIRLLSRRSQSIRYLLPDPVVHYIEEHGLYSEAFEKEKAKEAEKAKGKSPEVAAEGRGSNVSA